MLTIRVKIRDLELEGTGFDSFEKFEPVLDRVVAIWKESAGSNSERLGKNLNPSSDIELPPGSWEMSINSFAAKLGGDTCRDLLKIGATYLSLVQGKQRFPRLDLLAIVKESTRWKKSYGNQVARDIQRMIAQSELVENATDIYSVPANVLDEIRSKL